MDMNHPLVKHIRSLKRQASSLLKLAWILTISLIILLVYYPTIVTMIIVMIEIITLSMLTIVAQYRYMNIIARDEPVYLSMLIDSGKDKRVTDHVARLAELNNCTYICEECHVTFHDAVESCLHNYEIHRNSIPKVKNNVKKTKR